MRLAKYIVYSVYRFIYRFIGCIIDQSNWSGLFSLVVMTPDFHPGDQFRGQLWLAVFIYRSTLHMYSLFIFLYSFFFNIFSIFM